MQLKRVTVPSGLAAALPLGQLLPPALSSPTPRWLSSHPEPLFYSAGLATGALKPFVFIRWFFFSRRPGFRLTGTLQGRECRPGFCAGGLIKDGVFFSLPVLPMSLQGLLREKSLYEGWAEVGNLSHCHDQTFLGHWPVPLAGCVALGK